MCANNVSGSPVGRIVKWKKSSLLAAKASVFAVNVGAGKSFCNLCVYCNMICGGGQRKRETWQCKKNKDLEQENVTI